MGSRGKTYMCFGEELTITEIARKYDLDSVTVRNRILLGMPPEEVVERSRVQRWTRVLADIQSEYESLKKAGHGNVVFVKKRKRNSENEYLCNLCNDIINEAKKLTANGVNCKFVCP